MSALHPGMVLAGRYRVEAFLGRGAMGEVHRATQLTMNRTVALKVLTTGSLEPRRRLRFTREAELISQLSHPNVVQVFDFSVDDATGLPFLVFELVDGRTLLDLIRADGPVAEARAASILEQIARALAHAHHQGIIHRDLKPANVMLADKGDGSDQLVKVLDFGLAKMLGPNPLGDLALTTPGQLLGTPSFASPEQALGDRVDERSDLYALGCLLHALVTARAPFTASDPKEMARRKRQEDPPPLPEVLADGSRPSAELVGLHRRLLARAPSDRPRRAQDVAELLAQIASEARVGETLEVPTDVVMPTEVVEPTDVETEPVTEGMLSRATILADTVVQPPEGVRRARRIRSAAVAAFATLLFAGSAWLLRSEPAPVKEHAAAPTSPVEPVTPVTPVGRVTPEPVAQPVVVPVPRTRIHLTTTPPGAEVVVSGKLVGTSPIRLEIEEDDLPSSIRIEKAGHQPETLSIDRDTPPKISIQLKKRSVRVEKKKEREPEPYPVW